MFLLLETETEEAVDEVLGSLDVSKSRGPANLTATLNIIDFSSDNLTNGWQCLLDP